MTNDPRRVSRGFKPSEALKTNISYADIARPNMQPRTGSTLLSDASSSSDPRLSHKFTVIDNAIRDINTKLDTLFKLMQENAESNKAFRELVQVLIARLPK